MKVALVHDYLREYGGAEKVLESLHEIWPEAPIFTTIFLPDKLPEHFKTWDVRTSWLSNLPLLRQLSKLFTFFYPAIFESFDLSGYDVVISSSSGFAKGVKVPKPTIHINYCHTPPRFLYHLPSETNRRKVWFLRPILAIFDTFLRVWDFNTAQKVDFFIANSQTVKRRIEKFYRRDATVIYPPVEANSLTAYSLQLTAKQSAPIKSGSSFILHPSSFFLVVSRLSAYKNIDVAIEACNRLKLPLKIIGTGREEARLKKIAGSTIEFLGFVDEQDKWHYLAGCQALIFASSDEDFGIVPVEAMACGKPVIALKSGGVKETVVDGKTGVFFKGDRGQSVVDSLVQVLQNFDPKKFKAEDCQAQAAKFSKDRFKREIEEFASRVIRS
ncbi:glycosyltransferase [Candidatus Daviesbacteria bacterium]|nr:glycosyltransferase [Candidatus Daviesbacteria bacterium]